MGLCNFLYRMCIVYLVYYVHNASDLGNNRVALKTLKTTQLDGGEPGRRIGQLVTG